MNNNKNEFTYSGYQFSLLVIVMTCIIPVNSIGKLTGRSESYIVYNRIEQNIINVCRRSFITRSFLYLYSLRIEGGRCQLS